MSVSVERPEKCSEGPVPQTAGDKINNNICRNYMLAQKIVHGNGCIARRATHAAKALVERAQVFVIHVDGELAKALPEPSAEAAGVGPTARA